jgi:hypothetical protein
MEPSESTNPNLEPIGFLALSVVGISFCQKRKMMETSPILSSNLVRLIREPELPSYPMIYY